MSNSQKAPTPGNDRERIEDIIKAAHHERNEAIRQLFGFGFSVVGKAARGTDTRKTSVQDGLIGRAAHGH